MEDNPFLEDCRHVATPVNNWFRARESNSFSPYREQILDDNPFLDDSRHVATPEYKRMDLGAKLDFFSSFICSLCLLARSVG